MTRVGVLVALVCFGGIALATADGWLFWWSAVWTPVALVVLIETVVRPDDDR